MLFTKAALGLSAASSAVAATVEVWYNISLATANPDGLFERSVVGVNGTWPPPVLEATVNDTIIVHAYNGLSEGTALHHHGMFFSNSSYYDGAPGVTQCSIPPGESLSYTIPVATDEQVGTYWWHSHVGSQYVDGLRAPFIIHNTVEPHTYDDEYTLVMSDWYHDQHSVLIKQFMNEYNPTGAEPVPNSAAIYAAHGSTYLDGFNENMTITFEAGKTYRLRLINQSAFAMFFFWIDGHQLRIIEADGTDTEEYPVDHVTLSVAQRYSVLVTALNTTTLDYAMHFNFDSSMFDTVPDDLQVNFTSTLSYASGNAKADEEVRDVLDPTPDQDLVPVVVEAQMVATKNIELGVYFDTFDDGINRAAFNNITYTGPKTPSLFTQQSMGTDALNDAVYGPQTHAYILEKDEVIDLQIINWDANSHPFHLHGHKYQIVRVAQDVASNDTSLNPPHTEGAANPMRRDTIIVPAGGAVNIRFIADNPGTWIFHCHIEWHLEAGLAVVFIEAPTESQANYAIPQVMLDQCSAQGITPTGNAVGKMSVTDLAGVVRGPYPQILGWRPKGIGALAGTILAALLGMATVVWYAFGGQLDADDVEDEVNRELEKKKNGGLIKRNVKAAFAKKA